MRRVHQRKLLELADTLAAACGELGKQSGSAFAGLCAETQEFVSAFYNYAAGTAGEGRLTELLEALYEALYHAAQGETGRGKKRLLALAREIGDAARELRPDRIEVVFFCYKASMSDSLESVYLAAKADPACDAYFVPIPYYDRNPDGSFGEMRLEGFGYYPDSWELTDWREYDVEARHPDAVFIMNPYDEANLVTSVHPDFYSKRLRELTDLLVYIEYGLPIWTSRDPAATYEELRDHGHLLPAHVYSHYYITYSKELADGLKVLFLAKSGAALRHGIPHELSEKFVPLGSPKFDKVLHTRREDFTLPPDWAEQIAGKTVILFNTSLGALLENTKAYLRKLREVLEVFRASEDIALWWRPHPLSLATMESMRTEEAAEYISIVDGYRRGRWGIYDDSAELHRAIAYSDAYYGDESSLVYLYCATGKPLTICSKHHEGRWFTEGAEDFSWALKWQIENMQAKGANPTEVNCCVGWWTFYEDLNYLKYLKLFLDFAAHPEKYPDAALYKELQLRVFRDYVVNPDGTAGEKIYAFVKQKLAVGTEEETK